MTLFLIWIGGFYTGGAIYSLSMSALVTKQLGPQWPIVHDFWMALSWPWTVCRWLLRDY